MIIGLTGLKQNGKTSVANILERKYGFQSVSFADGVRAAALACDPFVELLSYGVDVEGHVKTYHRYSDVLRVFGYEGAKAMPDVRRLLQRMGTEVGREVIGPNVWVDALINRVLGMEGNIVIPDVRFPNEAEAIEKLYGKLFRVIRSGVTTVEDSHESEIHIASLPVDGELVAANLAELEQRVDEVMSVLLTSAEAL